MPSTQSDRYSGGSDEEGVEQIGYWGDQRLSETYLRLSQDIQQREIDHRTIHWMVGVEEELRDRGIDPDRVVGELWD